MEWWYPEKGYWVFEIVCGSIDAAIAEGRRRMRDFKWLTWRVSPYTECSNAPLERSAVADTLRGVVGNSGLEDKR
jgi:hypothetical protein